MKKQNFVPYFLKSFLSRFLTYLIVVAIIVALVVIWINFAPAVDTGPIIRACD